MDTAPHPTSAETDVPANAGSRPQSAAVAANNRVSETFRSFHQLVSTACGEADFYRALTAVISAESSCLSIWTADQIDAGNIQLQSRSDDAGQLIADHFEPIIKQTIQQSNRSGNIVSQPLQLDPAQLRSFSSTAAPAAVVAAPILGSSPSNRCIVGVFSNSPTSILRMRWLMGIAAQTVANRQTQLDLADRQWQQKQLAGVLQLINQIKTSDSLQQCGVTITNQLRKLTKSDSVALGHLSENGDISILAVSGVENADVQSETGRSLRKAMQQCVVAGKSIGLPNPNEDLPQAFSIPLQTYCQQVSATSAASVLLRSDDGKSVGVLVFVFPNNQISPARAAQLESIGTVLANQLQLRSLATRSATAVFKSKLKAPGRNRMIGIVAMLLFALMFVPMPYRIQCDSQLQPTLRRFVAAPFSSVLEKSLVEVGQVVREGEVIARLEGRPLRIELAGLQAQYDGAKRKHGSALALRQIAESQIQKSEMQRLAAEIELLQQRMKDLEIRSPIDGVIVSGDLEKTQGAPLEVGQNLFEIAPLETMVAEIRIPESEVQYTTDDDSVTIKLDAFPFRTWEGTIKNIHPRAEVIDQASVFVAEVPLPNTDANLRPGMKGAAKITTRWHPLGWNLFHQAWEGVRFWMIW